MKSVEQYTEEDHKAIRDLETASNNLRRSAGGKVGEQAEKKYGEAYSTCYKLGLKQYPVYFCKTTR